jgi:metal-responsive CopG/Arc/MetJ family transcriptional regulator
MARTHVVISDEVLEAIDRFVGSRGRSRFLEAAAREKLDRMSLEQALRDTAGVARGRTYSHWRDRRAAEDYVRTTRRTKGYP